MEKKTKCLSKVTFAMALLLGGPLAYAEGSAVSSDFIYQIQPGDNLEQLSAQLLDRPARWADVAKYNKLKDANRVLPQQQLHIPLAWMKNRPAQARIEAVTGEVKVNGRPAQVGDAVAAGDKVETASGAAARMHLPDGSTVSLAEKSELQAQELTQKERGSFFSAVFRLVTGRIDAIKKKYPEGQAPLRIQAMHGTIGVRGTHFRMGQEGDNTLAEIENGLVGFEAGKAPIALAGGQGSVADGVKAPAVIPLLGAPVVVNLPERFEKILVRVDLQTMPGAQAFRGEVAREEEFANVIAQNTSEGTQLRIPNLEDGSYWLRVRAIDARGLQGLEAHTRFVLKAHPFAPMLMGPNNNGKVRGVVPTFSWAQVEEAQRYRLRIARDAGFKDVVLTADEVATTSFTPEQVLPVGDYYWRVASVRGDTDQGPWGDVRMLRVLPPSAPPPAPAFTKGRMAVSWEGEAGQTFEYQLANHKDFAHPTLSLSLAEPKVDIAMPEPGNYFVRMRAIDADGYIGPWTPPQRFTTPGYEVGGCANCQWNTP